MSDHVSILLGDDDATTNALIEVLAALGAKRIDERWGLGGAVELTVTTIEIGDERVVVEQETYTGVTVIGSRAIVERIAALVDAQRAKRR